MVSHKTWLAVQCEALLVCVAEMNCRVVESSLVSVGGKLKTACRSNAADLQREQKFIDLSFYKIKTNLAMNWLARTCGEQVVIQKCFVLLTKYLSVSDRWLDRRQWFGSRRSQSDAKGCSVLKPEEWLTGGENRL